MRLKKRERQSEGVESGENGCVCVRAMLLVREFECERKRMEERLPNNGSHWSLTLELHRNLFSDGTNF